MSKACCTCSLKPTDTGPFFGRNTALDPKAYKISYILKKYSKPQKPCIFQSSTYIQYTADYKVHTHTQQSLEHRFKKKKTYSLEQNLRLEYLFWDTKNRGFRNRWILCTFRQAAWGGHNFTIIQPPTRTIPIQQMGLYKCSTCNACFPPFLIWGRSMTGNSLTQV